MDKVELRARLDFWQSALSKLRAAYLALVDNVIKLSLRKGQNSYRK